ncbi:hypothetical protein LTR36_010115 [Oleoguttula mirabilis]|uniref:RTA1-domain-containing protein n=1 Tax=Oleoguttula mirabilis TaxID=1507867 RepID=A0AAV9JRZ9_9PEZI|nr:hypothetical protein LTR36_010115 [Oleoguttula mirabilis]
MDAFAHILARGNENGDCTQSTCPVSESIYGYRPDLGATIFFLVVFTLSGSIYIWQGVRTKTWVFSIAMVLGSMSEAMGYVAKLLLWKDPFSDPGFKMSVVLLTFAPAFYAAGVYYTLKHICLTFGANFSRLRPANYTKIFITCDIFSISLQAAGGALASASTTDSILTAGQDVMIAGLAFQVLTLVVFGMFAADYGYAIYRNRAQLNPATVELRRSLRFRLFIIALWVAYFAILIRCAYRVAELAGGWIDNPILRAQGLFIGLDSVPIALAALILNIWHPGWCFPKEQQDVSHQTEKLASVASSDAEAQI